MSKHLDPGKALIFRIIHRDNLLWILDHGLHSKRSEFVDPTYVEIGNSDLIGRRNHHPVPIEPGGTLSDYIPFYFTPFSPMLLNIVTGWGGIRKREKGEIVIMVTSLHELKKHGVKFVFTDRHAYLAAAQFYSEIEMLDQIDWPMLQRRDFKSDPEDPSKKERYQAEALVYKHLPISRLLGIITYTETVKNSIDHDLARRLMSLKVANKPEWYL